MNPEEYLDALLALPGMWGSQVSRDGKWVAWLRLAEFFAATFNS
jgi:hypothetical protein